MKNRKRHDTSYPPTFTLRDNNGPVDLTLATTVRFYMQAKDGTIKATIALVKDSNQVANTGKCAMTAWPTLAVDTSGVYRVEVRVDWTDGTQATFPSGGYERLVIIDDLDNA